MSAVDYVPTLETVEAAARGEVKLYIGVPPMLRERSDLEVEILIALDRAGKRGLSIFELGGLFGDCPLPELEEALLDLEVARDLVLDGQPDSFKRRYVRFG